MTTKKSNRPRVVVFFDEDRQFSHYISEVELEIFAIDEACPDDRVYRTTLQSASPASEIDAAIGDSPIGHEEDDKMPPLMKKIRKFLKQSAMARAGARQRAKNRRGKNERSGSSRRRRKAA